MNEYYKAVRPDGTDFHSGKVQWIPEGGVPEGGHVVTHPTSDALVLGDASTYLSVATVPTECTGMRWPCRLLRVEPAGRVVRLVRVGRVLPRKRVSLARRVSLAWRVTEELPAHMALGPQGEEVAAIIDRTRVLTVDEARHLAAARKATRIATWDAAWYTAGDADRNAAWHAAGYAALNATRDAPRDAAWHVPWECVRDAVSAVLTRDLISAEHCDLLMQPWKEVVG